MPTIAQILSSKTVWFSILIAVLSVLQGFVFLLKVSPIDQMYIGIGISVLCVVLRAVTTQSLSEK